MASGRPRATTPETISEAACELFLERGYADTVIADIAARAGVSRSSFFNYFDSKAAILWSSLDARIAVVEATLRDRSVRAALEALGEGFAPDALALGLAHADAMGAREELERDAARRQMRIAAAVAHKLVSEGAEPLAAEIAGAAHGGAVLAAIRSWARDGAGRRPLSIPLARALDIAAVTLA